MKRDSLRNYFDKECNQQPQTNRTFWNVVKPLASNKGHSETYAISLFENSEMITDCTKICNIFNEHFVNIASDRCEYDEISQMNIAEVIDNVMLNTRTLN